MENGFDKIKKNIKALLKNDGDPQKSLDFLLTKLEKKQRF